MPGVPTLVEELRSRKPHSIAKEKKKKRKTIIKFLKDKKGKINRGFPRTVLTQYFLPSRF